MGSRLFSNTTNLLGGHDFLNATDREKIAQLLRISVEKIPSQNSWAYDQIVQGIADEKIKGLWVIATNSSHSWINQREFNEIVKKLDFLVVQDMYHTTETAQRAHLILPAAGWGEKTGTFINSERRIGLVKKVSLAPGQALSDFNIIKLVAQYWGCGKMFERWSSPESVFKILAELSRNQPCDFSGIRDYKMIDEAGGISMATSRHLRNCFKRSIPRRSVG
jgi:assimilatory nitrate reductase catalytic subunit